MAGKRKIVESCVEFWLESWLEVLARCIGISSILRFQLFIPNNGTQLENLDPTFGRHYTSSYN